MSDIMHPHVIAQLNEILNQLNELTPVAHPVKDCAPSKLQNWLKAHTQVKDILFALLPAITSDLPADTQALIQRIKKRESELIWQSDTEKSSFTTPEPSEEKELSGKRAGYHK